MSLGKIMSYAHSLQSSMVEDLRILVNYESPSRDKNRLNVLAKVLAERFRSLGATSRILESKHQGNHVRIDYPATHKDTVLKPVLILGHFDTVWPVGTLSRQPFRIEEDVVYGPGVFDMKGGIVVTEYALRILRDLKIPLARPVVVILNSDEEVGSPHSRKWIRRQAKESIYVLVMEPALAGGELKTERKGVGAFHINIKGRAAHAGSEPENGVNAIVELAHQILHVQSLADPELGTTLNVGTISGGTRSNVVPAFAEARIDGRVWTMDEARRIEHAFQQLKPIHPDAKLSVQGGFGRPPMQRLPGTSELFEIAARVGAQLGMTLTEGKTGGASDGNFCAAMGIPTLDGLGVTGMGAHAAHEQVHIQSLPERAALLAGILCAMA